MIDSIMESIASAALDLNEIPELLSAAERLVSASQQQLSELLSRMVSGLDDDASTDELFHALHPVILAMARRDQVLTRKAIAKVRDDTTQKTDSTTQKTDSEKAALQKIIAQKAGAKKAGAKKAGAKKAGSKTNSSPESLSHWPVDRLQHLLQLYRSSSPAAPIRCSILYWLAPGAGIDWQSDRANTWATLLTTDPPNQRSTIPLAFAPAMDETIHPDAALLEDLLHNSMPHLQIAPAVLDLLNFYVRSGQLEKHPAESRAESLTTLLGQLAGQLGKIEEGKLDPDLEPQQVGQQVSDAVALIVSICDTVALIGYVPAVGKLNQAASLRHRRVQTEAAAALTKLGNEQGRRQLIELAGEPVARLRVLNYAEELGITNDISLENRGEIAIAESHLAIWLSEPTQMGIAPSRISLVDNREMYWPGFEHPVQCYLFKFGYGAEEHPYENLAICGPMTHAFSADLTRLSHEDVYALFAGWQTVHDEIFQMAAERAAQVFPGEWQRVHSMLFACDDLSDIEIEFAGRFFGRLAIAASCTHISDGKGTVIADGEQHCFIPCGLATAPIDARLAFSIWQGRQLLSTFNPA